jgi:drug/metabolite transporter (DMT)-like permease
LDRLGRNLKHLVTMLEELQALGIAFVSLGKGIDATTPADKLRAMALAGLGVVFGIAAALALGRVIQNQLFGVGLFDPLTLTAVTVVLFASAGMASFLPARRAASVDPARAFRQS